MSDIEIPRLPKILPIPKKPGGGRKPLYDFWNIPADSLSYKPFNGVNVRSLQSALSQFKKRYGGEFELRQLSEDSAAVWCTQAPNPRPTK